MLRVYLYVAESHLSLSLSVSLANTCLIISVHKYIHISLYPSLPPSLCDMPCAVTLPKPTLILLPPGATPSAACSRVSERPSDSDSPALPMPGTILQLLAGGASRSVYLCICLSVYPSMPFSSVYRCIYNVYTYLSLYIYVCIYIYTYVYIYCYIYIYMCVDVYMYTYTCV